MLKEKKTDLFADKLYMLLNCMYIGNHNYNLNDRLLGSCMESLNRSYWMRPYFRRLVSASKLSHYNHLVVAGGRKDRKVLYPRDVPCCLLSSFRIAITILRSDLPTTVVVRIK